MRAAGYTGAVIGCDESLEASRLDGAVARDDDAAQVLYLASHGRFSRGNGYEAILHSTLWSPGSSGLGIRNLVVAVFDTCHLIDPSVNWELTWQQAPLAANVRVLLGFDGLAPCDRGSAQRGEAFARELSAGKTFADAWLIAVKSSLVPGTGTGVAIGIGDSLSDARKVLATARATAMPSARSGSSSSFCLKY
jgi:hypothetical protein